MRPRFDLAPVRSHVSARWPQTGDGAIWGSDIALSWPDTLGMGHQHWKRIVARGWLTTLEADHVAVALGLLPMLLWENWLESADDEPRCAWCRDVADLNTDQSRRSFCCAEHRRRWNNERRLFEQRRATASERFEHTSERVAAMSSDELACFLGLVEKMGAAA